MKLIKLIYVLHILVLLRTFQKLGLYGLLLTHRCLCAYGTNLVVSTSTNAVKDMKEKRSVVLKTKAKL